NADAIAALSPDLRTAYLAAVMSSLRPIFIIAACVAAVAFALTLQLREIPLRGVALSANAGSPFNMPRDATSLRELEQILALRLARENRWRVYDDLAKRAQVDLPAPELWMLARLGERSPLSAHDLSAELNVPWRDLEVPLDALCERGLAQKSANG